MWAPLFYYDPSIFTKILTGCEGTGKVLGNTPKDVLKFNYCGRLLWR